MWSQNNEYWCMKLPFQGKINLIHKQSHINDICNNNTLGYRGPVEHVVKLGKHLNKLPR